MSDRTTRLGDGEGLEIATPEDFGLQRDEEGDFKPIKQRVPGTDTAILVRPVVDVEPVSDVLEGTNPDDERVDAVAEKHVVEGIGSDGDLSHFPDYVVNGILQAIKDSSGHAVFQATQKRRLREEAQMLDEVGIDRAKELAEIADERMAADLEQNSQ